MNRNPMSAGWPYAVQAGDFNENHDEKGQFSSGGGPGGGPGGGRGSNTVSGKLASHAENAGGKGDHALASGYHAGTAQLARAAGMNKEAQAHEKAAEAHSRAEKAYRAGAPKTGASLGQAAREASRAAHDGNGHPDAIRSKLGR